MSASLQLEWTGADQANLSLKGEFIPFCKPLLDRGQHLRVEVHVCKDTKSRLQEQKMHAMIGDIAAQLDLFGKKLPAESWKRILVDAFKHDTKNDQDLRADWQRFGDIELVPALNHPGFVMVGEQTRRFSVRLASSFIEWLLAFGAERAVVWTVPKRLRGQQAVPA